MSDAAERIIDTATGLGLWVTSVFVPWSKAPKASREAPTLNWRVTLWVGDRSVLEVDYSAGCAHCPAYNAGDRSVHQAELIRYECEHGYAARIHGGRACRKASAKPIMPGTANVIAALVTDAGAINSDGFSDWCRSYGFDDDSIKAKATYDACIEIGLKLRGAVGDLGLHELQEACVDF